MGPYHMVLFVLRKQDPSPLYFGLFCLLIVLRILTTNEYSIQTLYPAISWRVLIRLEYLSFIWGVPAFTAFVRYIFKEEFSYLAVRLSIMVAVVSTALVFCTPPQIFTYISPPYQIIIIGFSLYGFYIVYKAWRRGKKEAIVFLLGFIAFFIAVINGTLHADEMIQTASYFPEGLFVFIFAQGFLIAIRFSRALVQAEQLGQKLNLINSTLEKRVSDRTQSWQQANENLLQKNEKIEEQNTILTKLNNELDHFVYSVSHDLRSPITSALGLIEVARFEQDPEQVKNYRSYRKHMLTFRALKRYIGR